MTVRLSPAADLICSHAVLEILDNETWEGLWRFIALMHAS